MLKIKVVCRHGVEYSLLARGNQAEANRLKEMLSNCCCYVCHNRGCETPIEGKQECRNECEIYGKKFCEKMEGIIMKNIQERAREYADRHKAAEIVGKVYGYERIYIAEMTTYEKGATDQKAIEEEVTLKKYDSMTEKQLDREEHFTSWYFQNVKGAPTFSDAIEWARRQTIDEACELIEKALQKLTTYKDKDNFTENEFKIITASRIPNWLIKFRKEMGE